MGAFAALQTMRPSDVTSHSPFGHATERVLLGAALTAFGLKQQQQDLGVGPLYVAEHGAITINLPTIPRSVIPPAVDRLIPPATVPREAPATDIPPIGQAPPLLPDGTPPSDAAPSLRRVR
jgi:hypothetical protein